jgi:hypothetical protein
MPLGSRLPHIVCQTVPVLPNPIASQLSILYFTRIIEKQKVLTTFSRSNGVPRQPDFPQNPHKSLNDLGTPSQFAIGIPVLRASCLLNNSIRRLKTENYVPLLLYTQIECN